MFWQLTSDDIAKNWDLIRFGALKTTTTNNPDAYSIGLLKNLLCNKNQCWFYMDSRREIKTLLITSIIKDSGDCKHLRVENLYGFKPTTLEEQNEVISKIIKFAETLKLSTITAHVSDQRVKDLVQRNGFQSKAELFEIEIRG